MRQGKLNSKFATKTDARLASVGLAMLELPSVFNHGFLSPMDSVIISGWILCFSGFVVKTLFYVIIRKGERSSETVGGGTHGDTRRIESLQKQLNQAPFFLRLLFLYTTED